MKLLIVDDDLNLSNELAAWLVKNDRHTVDQAFNAEDAHHFLRSYNYALIILDWELPDGSGVQILKSFRQAGGTTPVLMLTGRTSTSDKMTGLDTGSDDYLTKPFEAVELSARVRALLRRAYPDSTDESIIRFKNVVMDLHTRKVEVSSEPVKFQPNEFDLLLFLASHPKQIFSADRLIELAWPGKEKASDASLRVSLSRIRKKIQDSDNNPLIENLQGQGYRYNPPDSN